MEQGGFDLQELRLLYQGDRESLREILELFKQDALPRCRTLETTIASGDSSSAIKAAHSLANLLGAIRNTGGAEAARRCEKALRAADFGEAKRWRERVDRAVQESLDAIEAFG
ncbi:MAG: Hpt domain-containing protein [Alkalispirochaetaceae bacterium]